MPTQRAPERRASTPRPGKRLVMLFLAFFASASCGDDTTSSPGDGLTDASDASAQDTSADAGMDASTDTGEQDAGADAEEQDTSSDVSGQDTSTDAGDQDATTDADSQDAGGPELPGFRTCVGRAFTPSFSGEWDHTLTSVTAIGQEGHSVEDLIVTYPANQIMVEGKFAYGTLSVDLEDELVEAFIDDCSGWVSMGSRVTDSDGRARFSAPDSVMTQPGRYEVIMVVDGDGTVAQGDVLLVPPSTQLVVFDIDGTLTTDDGELFQEFFLDIFGGDHTPEMYPDAQTLVSQYSEAGYEVLFMTGRPYWLDALSQAWLEDRNFPRGNLRLTRELSEVLPTEDGVGAYKRDYLTSVLAQHQVLRAYGNADTDIFGYLEAGLPTEDVYIIGENAGHQGTQPISSYTEHLSVIDIPPAEQPFVRE